MLNVGGKKPVEIDFKREDMRCRVWEKGFSLE